VHLDFWRYFVEVKTNRDSLAATRAEQLERGLMSLHGDLSEFGIIAIEGSDTLHALLTDPATVLRDGLGLELRKDLRALLDQARVSGRPPIGRHDVGRYLMVTVGAQGEWGTRVGLAPETSDEEEANRVIRQIRRAAKQMPLAGRGFVIVEIGSVRNVVVLQRAFETAFANDPGAFEPVRGLVFHVGTPTETGHRLRRVFGGAAPGRRLDAAEQKILRALVSPRLEGGELVRETLYGEGTSKLVEITIESSGGRDWPVEDSINSTWL
jgi:hypothetical protein